MAQEQYFSVLKHQGYEIHWHIMTIQNLSSDIIALA